MEKHLVFVGAGHAHMTALLRLGDYLERGHRVTVISPSPYHYYSGMGPGMLSGIYRPQEVRFHVSKMAEERGAAFIEDRVVRIDPKERKLLLGAGGEVDYDLASFNTGSHVPLEPIAQPEDCLVQVKPVINLYRAREWILREIESRPLSIAVVGGGPAGVEVSANVWRLVRDSGGSARIILVGGTRTLADAPSRVRLLAFESLCARNIHIIEGTRAESVGGGRILLNDGGTVPYDIVFIAVGVKPLELFRSSGLPTDEGGALLVDRHLRSIAYPELFGGGDCVTLEERKLAKVGVYAVRQNPVLHHNLLAALQGGQMRSFDAGGSYMLIINMGDGTGILWRDKWTFDGRLSFMLKDYIDRRFMRRFQVSGELTEPLGHRRQT